LDRAQIAIRELRRAEVPACVCGDRCFDEGVADTCDLVADVVHFGHEHAVLTQDDRDHVVNDPAITLHPRAEVPLARSVE
jgi:hypothetical protein